MKRNDRTDTVAAVLAISAIVTAAPAFAASPYLGELGSETPETTAIELLDFANAGAVIVPETCGVFDVAAAPNPTPRPEIAPVPAAAPRPAVAPVTPLPPRAPRAPRLGSLSGAWYGVSLRCSDCSIGRAGREDGEDEDEDMNAFVWRFRSAPEIIDIEPDSPADRAGIRRGDVLTHLDGKPITTREAGRRFGTAKPGDSLEWTVRLGDKTRVVTVVAGERPEHHDYWNDVQAELRAAQEALAAQQTKLRAFKLDEGRLEELRMTQERLSEMARRLADLERERATLAPRGLLVDPDDVLLLPDDDRIRIVDRDRIVTTPGHRLRYRGEIGDSRVEVRGSPAVVVTEEKNGDLVIDTPDASIRVQKKK